MSVRDRLQDEMKVALRAREKVRLETIRGLLSELQYLEMQKGSVSDEDAIQIVQREIKKRKEELDYASKAGRDELIQKLHEEIAVVESFLPKQLNENELQAIIIGLREKNSSLALSDAMKHLKEHHSGQYDGKIASAVAKRVLG